MKNTLIIANIVLYFQSCGVKVSKNKVERLSGGERLAGESFYLRTAGHVTESRACRLLP